MKRMVRVFMQFPISLGLASLALPMNGIAAEKPVPSDLQMAVKAIEAKVAQAAAVAAAKASLEAGVKVLTSAGGAFVAISGASSSTAGPALDERPSPTQAELDKAAAAKAAVDAAAAKAAADNAAAEKARKDAADKAVRDRIFIDHDRGRPERFRDAPMKDVKEHGRIG